MKPVRIFKITFLILASAFIVLAIIATLFIKFYPTENILKMVNEKVEAALGRKITVKELNYSLGGVTLEGVSVHEEMSSDSPVLASVEKAELRLSLLSLLSMKLDFSSILLQGPRCNISFNTQGESNIGRLISGISNKRSSGLSAKISEIQFDDAIITLSTCPAYLSPLAGTYKVDCILNMADGIMIEDCVIHLPENRGTLRPELEITTSGGFKINGSVDIDSTSLLWVYRWGRNLTLPYNIINGSVRNLVITKEGVKGDVNATSTLLNTRKILRADGFCHVDIPGRTVFIGRAAGGVDRSSFYVESLHFTFDGKLIGFDIKKVNASVEDVAPLLKFIPVKLFGNVKGDLSCSKGMYNGALALDGFGYDRDLKIVDD
ncbi:MAG: AsmA family protein, partial [Spirochaetes bacterium]|nr:AsmA family protein [Spirochaetota bacterium]